MSKIGQGANVYAFAAIVHKQKLLKFEAILRSKFNEVSVRHDRKGENKTRWGRFATDCYPLVFLPQNIFCHRKVDGDSIRDVGLPLVVRVLKS